jgi:hypothetical protein
VKVQQDQNSPNDEGKLSLSISKTPVPLNSKTLFHIPD